MNSEEAMVVWTPLNEATVGNPDRGSVRVITRAQDDQRLLMSEGAGDQGWEEMTEDERQRKLSEIAKDLVEQHGLDAAAVYQEFIKINGWKI